MRRLIKFLFCTNLFLACLSWVEFFAVLHESIWLRTSLMCKLGRNNSCSLVADADGGLWEWHELTLRHHWINLWRVLDFVTHLSYSLVHILILVNLQRFLDYIELTERASIVLVLHHQRVLHMNLLVVVLNQLRVFALNILWNPGELLHLGMKHLRLRHMIPMRDFLSCLLRRMIHRLLWNLPYVTLGRSLRILLGSDNVLRLSLIVGKMHLSKLSVHLLYTRVRLRNLSWC